MINSRRVYIVLSVIIFIAGICNYYFILNRMEYALYGVFLLFSSCHILITGVKFPKHYLRWLIFYIGICVANATISKYIIDTKYFMIGMAFTFIPFVHYIISYNFTFDDRNIYKFIKILLYIIVLINSIAFVETFVFHTAKIVNGILGSSFFWFQYVASINSQGVIFGIVLYKHKKEKKYLYLVLYLALSAILSIQLKTFAGLVLIALGYSIIYNNKKNISRILVMGGVVICCLIGLMQIPQISRKIVTYQSIYIERNEGVARPELYRTSIQIARDHFPLGSGQGTFGSTPTNLYNSQVYQDYGLEYVWGLSNYDSVNFKQDTHWASIIGENGVLGTLLYMLLFLHPLLTIYKYRARFKEYFFMITIGYTTLITESLVLNLISRLSFIIIYAGVTGIIIRRVANKTIANHESITSNNQLSD